MRTDLRPPDHLDRHLDYHSDHHRLDHSDHHLDHRLDRIRIIIPIIIVLIIGMSRILILTSENFLFLVKEWRSDTISSKLRDSAPHRSKAE